MDYIEVQVVSFRNRLDGDGAGIFLEKQKDVSCRFRESIELEEGNGQTAVVNKVPNTIPTAL
jgi:hypothetical protein